MVNIPTVQARTLSSIPGALIEVKEKIILWLLYMTLIHTHTHTLTKKKKEKKEIARAVTRNMCTINSGQQILGTHMKD